MTVVNVVVALGGPGRRDLLPVRPRVVRGSPPPRWLVCSPTILGGPDRKVVGAENDAGTLQTVHGGASEEQQNNRRPPLVADTS